MITRGQRNSSEQAIPDFSMSIAAAVPNGVGAPRLLGGTQDPDHSVA
jgi:hypothetical protein